MDRIWRQIHRNSNGDGAQRARRPDRIPSAGDEPAAEAQQQSRSTIEKIKGLPTPVGVLLVGAGVAGLALPGPMGTPLILAGGLVLAPKMFGKVERFLERRFPDLHRTSLESVERFISDLEKRFPSQQE